jgi:hypothetical protein
MTLNNAQIDNPLTPPDLLQHEIFQVRDSLYMRLEALN